jgi:hypothetical protein
MSDRIIYISRSCPHCKKLLLGIHKYAFLKNQFNIVDISTQSYPDYIETVPTLVANQQMIKNEDVFGYMNNLVEQIFKTNPGIKNRYHPQQGQQQQGQQQQQQQQGQQQQPTRLSESTQQIGMRPTKTGQAPLDPVDELVGWCPDGGCTFAPISEANDDFSKGTVSLEDTRFSLVSDTSDNLSNDGIQKIPMENSNDSFQKQEKQKKMDDSYERLMNERNLLK